MDQLIGSRLRKEYYRAVCCHSLTYMLRNARLDGLQAGIKIGGRNINNFRYEDDTTLMAESEEELKSLLMRVRKGSERAGLKLNIKKKLRSWHPASLLHGKYKEKMWKK